MKRPGGTVRRAEEAYAKQIVETWLSLSVTHHDDGSRQSMVDFLVCDNEKPIAALEVTMDGDREAISLWKAAKSFSVPGLTGSWLVSLHPAARFKKLGPEIGGLLSMLEAAGITGFPSPGVSPSTAEALNEHGIVSAHQGPTRHEGVVRFMPHLADHGLAGRVPDGSDHLATWISDFLGSDERRDVRKKLSNTALGSRHAFVWVPPFATAPFEVRNTLMEDEAVAPTVSPALPDEVTHVWISGTGTAGRVFYFDSTRWHVIEKSFRL